MKETIKLTVTQEDIDKAFQMRKAWATYINSNATWQSCVIPASAPPSYSATRHCPIAQALLRTFHDDRHDSPRVGIGSMAWEQGGSRRYVDGLHFTHALVSYITDWDMRWRAFPHTFRLVVDDIHPITP